jgi:hypothetical protein
MDGTEFIGPDEGPSGVSEGLSEEAKQRFAGTANAIAQIKREERVSKKRDTGVAQTILQFLTDNQRQHLSLLIAEHSARNCPSIFILALLSLINKECLAKVQEYLTEKLQTTAIETVDESLSLMKNQKLDIQTNRMLIDWITRLQMVLSLEAMRIVPALMIDEKNMDGSVLQLTVFIIQDFFRAQSMNISYEKLQPLSASILQAIFKPHMGEVRDVLDASSGSGSE